MASCLVVAHRGASAYAPENTLSAFRRAVELGADFMELDVRLSADGELVVIHDDTVDRTTNGTGLVSDFSIEELKELVVEGCERISTLREVFEELKGKVGFYVEVKVEDAEERLLSLMEELDLKIN